MIIKIHEDLWDDTLWSNLQVQFVHFTKLLHLFRYFMHTYRSLRCLCPVAFGGPGDFSDCQWPVSFRCGPWRPLWQTGTLPEAYSWFPGELSSRIRAPFSHSRACFSAAEVFEHLKMTKKVVLSRNDDNCLDIFHLGNSLPEWRGPNQNISQSSAKGR